MFALNVFVVIPWLQHKVLFPNKHREEMKVLSMIIKVFFFNFQMTYIKSYKQKTAVITELIEHDIC